jgi:hypothetical protein
MQDTWIFALFAFVGVLSYLAGYANGRNDYERN